MLIGTNKDRRKKNNGHNINYKTSTLKNKWVIEPKGHKAASCCNSFSI